MIKSAYYKVATDGVTTFYFDGKKFHSRSINNPQEFCNVLNDAMSQLTNYEVKYLKRVLGELCS